MLKGTASIEELESRLPPETLKVYREAFSVYDINGDGVIETHELVQVMKNIGASMTENDLHNLLQEAGVGDNVDFHAFLQIMFSTSGDATDDIEQSIRASFRVLDADGDGLIGIEECKLYNYQNYF